MSIYVVGFVDASGKHVSKTCPVVKAPDAASAAAVAAGRVFGSVVPSCTARVCSFDFHEAPRTFEVGTEKAFPNLPY